MINIKTLVTLIVMVTLALTAKAQETSPLIKGNVEISVKKGTIACDLVLSNLPNVKNYVIRLNSGMNIHYFKDLKGSNIPLYYDMDTKDSVQSDETKAYYLHENRGNPARYIPEELEVKYLGMYPVIADSASGYMGQDWRGNIAFNGYSVRAEGLQGDWYPVLYDKDTRKLYQNVRYNINVSCSDCNVLFVNGSSPVKASQANFVSDVPRELSIFCGDFKASERKGVWLLNSGLTNEGEQKLFDVANAYEAYYEKKLTVPFNGNLTIVQTAPVADPKDWGFGFFSAPTTFNVGAGQYGFQTFFDADNSASHKKTIAHELAHYYFGTLVKPYGPFGHVIEEGFAEYLSFRLTRTIEGEENYLPLLKNKIRSLDYLHNYRPFSQVKNQDDYGNREYYLYYYAPVLLLAIEKEIGEPAMWKWLKTMVATKTDHADYDFLLSTFNQAIADKALQQKIVSQYFTSENALKNAKEVLGEK